MWDSLQEYFNTLEQRPLERLAFIVGSLLILWMIEGAIPLLSLKYKKNKTRHAASGKQHYYCQRYQLHRFDIVPRQYAIQRWH